MEEQTEKLLTVKEAITHIRSLGYGMISAQTVYVWCRNRGIGQRFGGRWMVREKKLNKLLEKGF